MRRYKAIAPKNLKLLWFISAKLLPTFMDCLVVQPKRILYFNSNTEKILCKQLLPIWEKLVQCFTVYNPYQIYTASNQNVLVWI